MTAWKIGENSLRQLLKQFDESELPTELVLCQKLGPSSWQDWVVVGVVPVRDLPTQICGRFPDLTSLCAIDNKSSRAKTRYRLIEASPLTSYMVFRPANKATSRSRVETKEVRYWAEEVRQNVVEAPSSRLWESKPWQKHGLSRTMRETTWIGPGKSPLFLPVEILVGWRRYGRS